MRRVMFLKPLISGERFFGNGLSIGVLWVRKHSYRGDLHGYYYWVISLHYYSSSSLDGYSTPSLIICLILDHHEKRCLDL